MTTFDLVEVRSFVADLDSRMKRCDNGESMECADLDGALRHYALLCCELRESVRQWGRVVFAGRAAYDPEVEHVWLDECARLYSGALKMLDYSIPLEVPCYILDGQDVLKSALWDLDQLLAGWVTPKLAVGPSARQGLELTPHAALETHRRISALSPLPSNWRPADRSEDGKAYLILAKRIGIAPS